MGFLLALLFAALFGLLFWRHQKLRHSVHMLNAESYDTIPAAKVDLPPAADVIAADRGKGCINAAALLDAGYIDRSTVRDAGYIDRPPWPAAVTATGAAQNSLTYLSPGAASQDNPIALNDIHVEHMQNSDTSLTVAEHMREDSLIARSSSHNSSYVNAAGPSPGGRRPSQNSEA